MRWLPIAVIAGCIAASGARVAAAWSQLPPVMASHFDAAGNADGFMARGAFFTSLALIFGTLVLMLTLLPLLLRVVPVGAVNVPHREYWFAPERRAASLARLERGLAWFPVPIAALFVQSIELTIQANLHRTGLNSGAFWLGLALVLGSYAILTAKLYRQFASPPAETRATR
jgi:uncharacterized protein DUF1648